MARVYGHQKTILWGKPDVDPPEGFEYVHMRGPEQKSSRDTPDVLLKELERLGDLHGWEEQFAGKTIRINPWSIGCQALTRERRTISSEGRFKIRRKNLWRRLRKKYPLEAEILYVEEVEKRREYYGVWTKRIPIPPAAGEPTAHTGRRLANW